MRQDFNGYIFHYKCCNDAMSYVLYQSSNERICHYECFQHATALVL